MYRLLLLVFLITPSAFIVAQNANSDSFSVQRIVKTPYDSMMVKADSAIAKQDFAQAKDFYAKALQLKPRDAFALEMVREMNNTIRIQSQAQVRDNELKRKAEITSTLDQALNAILERRYDTAKALYMKVLNLKPAKSQEEFAIQKINSINQALGIKSSTTASKTPVENVVASVPVPTATVAKPLPVTTENKVTEPKQKSKLDLLIDSAQKAVTEMNYEKAYRIYTHFLSLNPSKLQREAALSKIQAINAELRKSQEASAQKETPVAVSQPQDFTRQTNDSLAKIASIAEQRKAALAEVEKRKTSEDTFTKNQFDAVVTKAIKALNEENWPVALDLYNSALTLNPTKVQEDAIRKEIDVINGKIAKSSKKVATAKNTAPAFQKTDSITAKNSSTVKQPSSTLSQNTTNKPVLSSSSLKNTNQANSGDNTKASNNDVNVNHLDQVFDASDPKSISQVKEFSKRFISQPAKLNISDSSNDVKLTCQGVTFNGKNAFIKFLIRNESSAPFNLGNFQVVYVKNYGILKKLNPLYITETPSIAANKEYRIVYVTEAPRSVQPDEVFVFEMEDQQKQSKLIVNVSGAAFLEKNTLAPTKISIDEAGKYIGEMVTICDNVTGGRFLDSSKTQPTLLNMGGVFPNHKLTILINFADRKNFTTPPEKTYSGKNVCVTGMVIDFKGKPEIIVSKPEELRIDETKQGVFPLTEPK